jgi:hypothetical protein
LVEEWIRARPRFRGVDGDAEGVPLERKGGGSKLRCGTGHLLLEKVAAGPPAFVPFSLFGTSSVRTCSSVPCKGLRVWRGLTEKEIFS